MDPEDLREVLVAYQEACRGVIKRYGGFIARYMGDGILVYFGYPIAHEDEAERAVRTGLGIVATVGALRPRADLTLKVRVGIATGVVVVGDLVGEGAAEERAVLGETPNLAARLQGLASPNTIVIAPATKRLVEGRFWFTDLGEHPLKGLPAPVRAWRVDGESTVDGQLSRERSTAVIGREPELALLNDRWRRTTEGAGQAVYLAGEAGIGKSSLVAALARTAQADPHTLVHFRCSPYHQQSPFHPFLTQLARAVRFLGYDTREAKLDKLELFLRASTIEDQDAAPILAAALDLPGDQRYGRLAVSAQRQRQRTLELLQAIVVGLAHHGPVLAIFDDAHWADPSSLDLLSRLVAGLGGAPLCLIVTHRPEFTAAPGSGSAATIALQRLTQTDSERLIAAVARKPLPPELVRVLAAKADGVPLFLEELSRSVIEGGGLVDRGDRYELVGPLPSLAIPSTLHDSLMARLDRLPQAK